jgi:hypothetical protein
MVYVLALNMNYSDVDTTGDRPYTIMIGGRVSAKRQQIK